MFQSILRLRGYILQRHSQKNFVWFFRICLFTCSSLGTVEKVKPVIRLVHKFYAIELKCDSEFLHSQHLRAKLPT